MKIRPIPQLHSTRPQIFDGGYEHPWYEHNEKLDKQELIKPNPPTQQAIEKAKFIDKPYHWNRDDSIRPRDKRTSG